MSLRFRRRFQVAPGISLNLSRSAGSAPRSGCGVRMSPLGAAAGVRRSDCQAADWSWSEYQPYRHHLVEPHPGATLFWIVILVIVFAWLLGGGH